jgi:hypothetical protein
MPIPPQPQPTQPPNTWEHFALWEAVKSALFTLPSRFESELVISGVLATDLFAFNSSLGATIEEQLVASLNRLRSVWDPDDQYAHYSFERQPQTFPDVVLRHSDPNFQPRILMGIELKGWYVLAKEREPSFRYKVTPAVCAPADLLVVVPWALSRVISGSPQVFSPFVLGAREAAEYRNWYWEHVRTSQGDKGITLSTVSQYYPSKSDTISDRPNSDSGSNFGRLARSRVMDNYIDELFEDRLVGIPLIAWQRFLGFFTESNSPAEISAGLDRMSASLLAGITEPSATFLRQKFAEIAELLNGD